MNKFVNSRTLIKKESNGNYKPRTIPPLKKGRNIITSPDKIANTFADHYINILRDSHKKSKLVKNRKKKNTYKLQMAKTVGKQY